MDVEYLSEEELDYELKLRKQETLAGKDQKKRNLKYQIKQESCRPQHLLYEASIEIADLESKLEAINAIWLVERNRKNPAVMVKCRSKLHHINRRIENLRLVGENIEEVNKLLELHTTIYTKIVLEDASQTDHAESGGGAAKGAISKRKKKPEKNIAMTEPLQGQPPSLLSYEEQDMLQQALKVVEKLSQKSRTLEQERYNVSPIMKNSSEEGEGDDFSLRSFRRRSTGHRCEERHAKQKFVPVSDWKVRFNGSDGGKNVLDFLSEVTFLAGQEKISESELHRKIYHLLEGEALRWYRAFYKNFGSWSQLVQAFKHHFLHSNHDFHELEKIRKCVQKPKENFRSFFTRMELHFQRLIRPLEERDKIMYLRQGMLSNYRAMMAAYTFQSASELLVVGKRVEENTNMLESHTSNRSEGRDRKVTVSVIDQGSTKAEEQSNVREEFQRSSRSRPEVQGQSPERKCQANTAPKQYQQTVEQVPSDQASTYAASQVPNPYQVATNSLTSTDQGFVNPQQVQYHQPFPQIAMPQSFFNPFTHHMPMNYNPAQPVGYQAPWPTLGAAPVNQNEMSQPTMGQVKCFRCKGVGHVFRNCTVPMGYRLFCYRCGQDDVTISQCPRCSNRGNAQ
jgi:Retrotransposon gag protein